MKIKKRLDLRLQELYPQYTRTQLASFIMQGLVTVENTVVTKPGTPVVDSATIELQVPQQQYVCRAAYKLEHALTVFGIEVAGCAVLDAGLSTGGFADCLLQRGAHRVIGVDVGYGQVHEKIRHDPRVRVVERTNLRTFFYDPTHGEQVDLATLDLSFISVRKVMDAVTSWLKPRGKLVVLIKPQFEAGRYEVGAGGIVKDPRVHERVVRDVVAGIEGCGFQCGGVVESPILGAEGNKEFLAYFVRQGLA